MEVQTDPGFGGGQDHREGRGFGDQQAMTTMTTIHEAEITTYQERRRQLKQVVTFAPTGRPFFGGGRSDPLGFFYRRLKTINLESGRREALRTR